MTDRTTRPQRHGMAFIASLAPVLALDTGFAARLRREAGTPLSKSRSLVQWYRFMERVPADLHRPGHAEIAFLVATLFAHDRRSYRPAASNEERTSDATIAADDPPLVAAVPASGSRTNLGGSLGSLVENAEPAKDPLARRLTMLLDASLDADGRGTLPWRLRHTLALVRSKRSGPRGSIGWPRLLDDLLDWNHPERRVQREWARAFYRFVPRQLDETVHAADADTP